MGAGVADIILVLIGLGAGYYVLTSGVLKQALAQPAQQPIAVTPVTTSGTISIPVSGTTPTTTTGNPIQDLLDQLFGTPGANGGINTIPGATTPGTAPAPGPAPGPIYAGNPQTCSSVYHGKCNTECASPNSSECQACQQACGGAAVGAVQTLPSQGGANQQLCSSKYHGKCNTECESPNSSECQSCKQACGSFYGTYAYYTRMPMNQMTSTVWKNNNYSSRAAWNINVTNAQ